METMKTTPELEKKICSKCLVSKSLGEFYKDGEGRRSDCSMCNKSKTEDYRRKNPQKAKLSQTQYRKSHKLEQKERNKQYYRKNKQLIINQHRKYKINKRKNDIGFRIINNLRSRLYKTIKNNQKSSSTISLLGCDIKSVKQHLESKWKPGMTWENWTYDGWHLDHIKPCASFDLSKPEQQKTCFHYTNLQPLWATTEIARKHGDFEGIGNLNKSDIY